MIPKHLLEDIAEGRCLPFIGAGFSLNASLPPRTSMPSWNDLASEFRTELEVKTKDPIKVATEYEEAFGRVRLIEKLRKLLHINNAKPGEVHRSFAKITSFDTVYTTNFDFLLEDAYRLENSRSFQVLVGDLQLPFHAGVNTTNIVKMHGDLNHTQDIVLTEPDYKDFLKKYPVIATHLSSMLITRTALFIGYSLQDPNFKQIKTILESRLGKFMRRSYIVAFDVDEKTKKEYKENNLNVINLKTNPNKTKAMLKFLDELYNQTTTKAYERTSTIGSTYEPIEEKVISYAIQKKDKVILESTSNSCYVSFPQQSKDKRWLFAKMISPIISRFGLRSIVSRELGTNRWILDDIRSTILQSKVCIFDVTGNSHGILYELSFALANNKSVIIISEGGAIHDYQGVPVIHYTTTAVGFMTLMRTIEHALQQMFYDSVKEVKQLVENGMYKAAFIIMMSHIEIKLRKLISKKLGQQLDFLTFTQLLTELKRGKLMDLDMMDVLKDCWRIRNKAVHDAQEPPIEVSKDLINAGLEILEFLEKDIEKIKNLGDRVGKISVKTNNPKYHEGEEVGVFIDYPLANEQHDISVNVDIRNLKGNIMATRRIQMPSSPITTIIAKVKDWKKGTYYVNISGSSGESSSEKFTILK